jgi:hypothetical protein
MPGFGAQKAPNKEVFFRRRNSPSRCAASDAARGSSPTPWDRFADHQSQRWADDGIGQTVDALECPRLGRAPAKEPVECVPQLVVGHEPVGFVLAAQVSIGLLPRSGRAAQYDRTARPALKSTQSLTCSAISMFTR